MSSDYFNPPLNTIYSPPIKKSLMELPLKDMLWEDFEELCLRMVEYEEGFDKSECEILGRKGQKQDGIDIYARKGSSKYSTFQCKKYKSISISQLTAIFEEFKKGEWFSKSNKFYLCITLDFSDVNLQRKFEELKEDFNKESIKIKRWDYSIINRILKNHPNIVFDFFGEEWCKQFCGISPSELTDFEMLKNSFKKSSKFLVNIKNYFENKPETHIARKETNKVVNWVSGDLGNKEKNLFILKGEKGLGKTVILKDVYDELINKGYNVLAIKADKFYALNVKNLEYQIFLNDKISINKIIQTLNYRKEKLVIIIDQLDALSQTLSSKREYLNTYNRIINELIDERNIRIIISARTFDLNYDADLRQYISSEFSSVEVSLLELKDVNSVLSKYKVFCSSIDVLELLRTPNHLEVFCKLPNKNKINLDSLLSLNDLYNKLWEDIISNQTSLNLSAFLYKISDDMYSHQRIIVNGAIKREFSKEFNFLRSNEILIYHSDEDQIQFFHQTFYDYCFSRNFVEQGKEILEYLFKNQQNLEIRSVVKMVFEYLREYNNQKYLKSITSILKHKKTRFHIKLLLINSISLIKNPNKYEKRIVLKIILNSKDFEEAFIDSLVSKGWIELLVKEDIGRYLNVKKTIDFKALELLKNKFNVVFHKRITYEELEAKKRNLIWKLFRKNINNSPVLILAYLDSLSFSNKKYFITNMILNIDVWKEEILLKYFEKYLVKSCLFKEREQHIVTSIAIKIFEYHPDYIGGIVRRIFINLFEEKEVWKDVELSHYNEELLNKMDEINTDYSFELLFDIYKEIIEKYKANEDYKFANSSLYSCAVFSDNNERDYFKEFLQVC